MTSFLALDFETGGVDHARHAPVQIGACLFTDGNPGDSFKSLIGPPTYKGKIGREYSIAALEVSRIKWSDIKAAPSPHTVLKDLAAWVDERGLWNHPVVCYNAPFDYGFFAEWLFLSGGWDDHAKAFRRARSPLLGGWHCAMALANWCGLYGGLSEVATALGLQPQPEPHDALSDAILAGRVWIALQDRKSKTEAA